MTAGDHVAPSRAGADEVLAVIRGVVETVLEVPAARVSRDTRLHADLRADSIALVEMADLIEERLGLPTFRIVDADLDDIVTIGEVVDYVVGRL